MDESEAEDFRGLFDRNHSALLAYSVRRLTSYDDALDVVAEVFMVAWRRRADLPVDTTEQRMWLYGVARRVLSNRHRAEIRLSRLHERLTGVALKAVPDQTDADDVSDLASAVEALNKLGYSDREILLLSLWEDLDTGQIAIVMGRSKSNVSVRLHRAKARLRGEFFRQMKETDPGGHVIDRRAHGDVATETTL